MHREQGIVRRAPSARSKRPAVSSVDRSMVEMACRWMPFGGPPAEDIMVNFGLTPNDYYRRLDTFVVTQQGFPLPVELRELISSKLSHAPAE